MLFDVAGVYYPAFCAATEEADWGTDYGCGLGLEGYNAFYYSAKAYLAINYWINYFYWSTGVEVLVDGF